MTDDHNNTAAAQCNWIESGQRRREKIEIAIFMLIIVIIDEVYEKLSRDFIEQEEPENLHIIVMRHDECNLDSTIALNSSHVCAEIFFRSLQLVERAQSGEDI